MNKKLLMTTLVLGIASSGLAQAQKTTRALPPPQSDNDPIPTAPQVEAPRNGITEQAGVGGNQAFARAGVMELGGSGSLTIAKGLREFSLSPSVGYFFMDNWQLSGIFTITSVKSGNADAETVVSALIEPSFHAPFSNTVFGFIGLGGGLSHSGSSGSDLGFSMAPRVGMKTLVGRSGLLTVDLRNTFVTNDVVETSRATLIGVSSILAVGAGYTVMW